MTDQLGAAAGSTEGFFRSFFLALERDPASVAALIGDEVVFSVVTAPEEGTRGAQTIGGPSDLVGALAAAGPPRLHHRITFAERDDDVELALGDLVDEQGDVVASFICSGRLAADGRLVRLLLGRTVPFVLSAGD